LGDGDYDRIATRVPDVSTTAHQEAVMNNLATRTLSAAALVAAFGAPLVLAGPASASHGGSTAVVNSGHCSGGGVFKLKAKHDDARIEVEYQVDTNRAGQVWHVILKDNGKIIYAGRPRTVAPSGSFTVHRLTANRVGRDSITAWAALGSRRCGGHVTL
jgi:hypothetical protein